MTTRPAGAPWQQDSIRMENLKVREVQVLGAYSTGMFRASAYDQFVTGQVKQMAVEFQTSLLARHQVGDKQELVVRCPTSWWQHWKADKAPKWFLKRWPVRWHTHRQAVSFTRYDTYPRADVPIPAEFGRAVAYDTIAWEMPLVQEEDSPCTVFQTDSDVSSGRRFIARRQLENELYSLVYLGLTDFILQRPPPPGDVLKAVLDALEGLGVDLGALVQQQDLDRLR